MYPFFFNVFHLLFFPENQCSPCLSTPFLMNGPLLNWEYFTALPGVRCCGDWNVVACLPYEPEGRNLGRIFNFPFLAYGTGVEAVPMVQASYRGFFLVSDGTSGGHQHPATALLDCRLQYCVLTAAPSIHVPVVSALMSARTYRPTCRRVLDSGAATSPFDNSHRAWLTTATACCQTRDYRLFRLSFNTCANALPTKRRDHDLIGNRCDVWPAAGSKHFKH